jgi:hypothetical protein
MIKVLTTKKFHDQRRERLMRYDNGLRMSFRKNI